MNPYRTMAPPPIQMGPRWGVTLWRRLYVRVARIFTDMRQPYRYQREYNQYLRDLADWKRKYGPRDTDKKMTFAMAKLAMKRPPMPAPPPIYIRE